MVKQSCFHTVDSIWLQEIEPAIPHFAAHLAAIRRIEVSKLENSIKSATAA